MLFKRQKRERKKKTKTREAHNRWKTSDFIVFHIHFNLFLLERVFGYCKLNPCAFTHVYIIWFARDVSLFQTKPISIDSRSQTTEPHITCKIFQNVIEICRNGHVETKTLYRISKKSCGKVKVSLILCESACCFIIIIIIVIEIWIVQLVLLQNFCTELTEVQTRQTNHSPKNMKTRALQTYWKLNRIKKRERKKEKRSTKATSSNNCKPSEEMLVSDRKTA